MYSVSRYVSVTIIMRSTSS